MTDDWNIKVLEDHFASVTLPEGPIRLNAWTVVSDVKLFVESSLATIKKHNGNPLFQPYYDRLILFRDIVSSHTLKEEVKEV